MNFAGNAAEALAYYQKAFGAPAPYVMHFSDMPKEDQEQSKGMEHLVIYSNLKTYAGDLMMSDDMPGQAPTPPGSSLWIAVTHDEEDRLRSTFDFLARDRKVLLPLAPTFFSPLYGQLKDKYGFHWMMMMPSPMEG